MKSVVTHLFGTSNFICSRTHPPLLFSGLGPLFLLFILLFSRPILLNLTRGAWRLNEVCRLWNKHQQSPCTLQNQSCKYGQAHKCTVCSKPGCKALVHNNVSPPVANACDLQTPQGTHAEPSSSSTPPTPGAHSQPSTPLFLMPTLPHLPANYLSI